MSDMLEQARLLREVRVALQKDDYPTAIKNLKRAAKLAGESGDVGMESRHLGNLALIYHRLGQPEQALKYFRHALVRARREGDRATEDGLLGNMGNILRELGHYDEAIDHLQQALQIAEDIGDQRGRGIWLGNLGLVYDDLGQHAKAIERHRESVAIAREINDQRGLAQRLGNLGNSYLAQNDYSNALQQFLDSVEIYRDLGDQQALALRLGIIGNLYAEIGRQTQPRPESRQFFQAALDHYTLTMNMARELGDRATEAELLRSAGGVLGEMGQYDRAIDHFNAAKKLFAILGLRDHAANVQQHIDVTLQYRDGN